MLLPNPPPPSLPRRRQSIPRECIALMEKSGPPSPSAESAGGVGFVFSLKQIGNESVAGPKSSNCPSFESGRQPAAGHRVRTIEGGFVGIWATWIQPVKGDVAFSEHTLLGGFAGGGPSSSFARSLSHRLVGELTNTGVGGPSKAECSISHCANEQVMGHQWTSVITGVLP